MMFIKTFKIQNNSEKVGPELGNLCFQLRNISILYPEILDQIELFGIALSYKLTKRKRFTNEKFYETSKIDIAIWFNKTEI